jgi:DtxR family Mn-dependent transcriptional regulator
MLSAKMEDYIKAIYDLQRAEEGAVSTSRIAEALDVTPPTATSMMEKLEERGLVDREKYRGVTLTGEGETVALEVLRHHRLLETYLQERLGYNWATVHDEADRLEHHISEEFEQRVAEALGNPEVDPHGDPIPSDTLDPVDEGVGTVLGRLGEGARVAVQRVSDRDPEELEYLDDAGVVPGTEMTVTEVAPIGMMTVELADGTTVSLPDRVADSIRVRVVDGDEATGPPA